VGIVYLRNPRNPSPEIEYLRERLPGVDVRVDPKVDVLLLKLPDAALREVTESRPSPGTGTLSIGVVVSSDC